MNYEIGSVELIDKMKDLWEAQRDYHGEVSTHFSEMFYKLDFESRKKSLIMGKKRIRIVLVKELSYIGYCISFVDSKTVGEVFSLYLEPDYRGEGIADHLMVDAVEWMKSLEVKKIQLSVAVGNERVIKFYDKFGFKPLTTSLELNFS